MKRHRRREIERTYAQVPAIACKGLCHASCGPVPLSRTEHDYLAEGYGQALPQVTDPSLTCPLLTAERRCQVHSHRPLLCRLWGVVPGMPCPHGCEAAGGLPDREARRLIDRLYALTPGEPPRLLVTRGEGEE